MTQVRLGFAQRSFIVLGIVLAAASGTGCSKRDAPPPSATGASTPSTETKAASPTVANAAPAARRALEVKAELTVDVKDVADERRIAHALEDVASSHGGYVAQSALGSTSSDPAHVVLRVPPSDIGAVRAALGGAAIAKESVTTTDVTDALADVDARVHAAEEEERRLLDLLEKKTGSLPDVLASERALADVRERIERLEAEQRVARGRVDLATVEVWLRPAATAAAPEGVVAQLDEAAKDGVHAARDVTITLAGVALRGGPTVLLFAVLAWGVVAAARRWLRRGVQSAA